MDNISEFLENLKQKIKKGELSNEMLKKISELQVAENFDNNFSPENQDEYMKWFITGWYIHTQILKNKAD